MQKLIVSAARAGLILAIAITLWFALYPGPNHPHMFAWDKADHLLAFGTLTAFSMAAAPRAPAVWLMLGLAVFGAALELAQATPLIDRDATLGDWLAEAIAIAAVGGAIVLLKLRNFLLPASASAADGA